MCSYIRAPVSVLQVKIGFGFVFKTVMEAHAGLVMGTFIAAVCLACAWSIHACESFANYPSRNYSDALWLIIITFFTVCSTSIYYNLPYLRAFTVFRSPEVPGFP